jgi:TolB-like protein
MADASSPEHPGFSEVQKAQVRSELEAVCASDAFKGGKRAQEFLELVVEHALAGRFDNLRERMLGVEMFARPVDYDTANDAVVRVKASEVRRRLAQFYSSLSFAPVVRIDLPPGSYVPQFTFATESVRATQPRLVAASPAEPKIPRWEILAACATLLVIASLIAWRFWRPASGQAPFRSIAILPLSDFSSDPKQDYFADGMTAELTTELAQVSSVRVIARTSTMSYKGTTKTIPQIAAELGVDAVVEGSVQLVGNQVRITTQLIDAKTDRSLWAHTYDRAMTNVLQLQSEVAEAICNQVRAEITPQEQSHFNRAPTVHPQAVELYLRGMQQLLEGSPGNAIELLQQAIAQDPQYAEAHAALADAYGWEGDAGWMPYTEAFSRQRSEALLAIQLDDSLSEPHLQLAMAALNQSWDWATAQKELQTALALGPNATNVHWAWANVLLREGNREQALAEGNKALQLDPVSSRAYMNRAWIQYFTRNYDAALDDMQHAAMLPHTARELTFILGDIYAEKNLYDEAVQQFRLIGDTPHALGHLGNLYARHGDAAAALALTTSLKQQIAKSGIGRYEVALIFAGLHRNDEAFQWLHQAVEAHDKGLLYIKIDPCLDPLRPDPRFAELIRRVGFPGAPS